MNKTLLFGALVCLSFTSCESPKKTEPTNPTAMTSDPTRAAVGQDHALTDTIRQALGSYSAAQTVVVTVYQGVARLSGTVANSTAKEEIGQIVGKIPGVIRVDNQIEVK